MKLSPQKVGLIHFVGIGGIGMSGIAEVLHNLGYAVQGSDLALNASVKRLQAQGIPVIMGHHPESIQEAQVLVVSSAICGKNPEVQAARAKNIPIIRRAEMLAELMKLKQAIAIAGTHGKTTTTSLVAALLDQASFDPTVVNGGIINAYGSNARLGKGDWIVVEADESDGTFRKLPATIAAVTNIDPEHMEFYGTQEVLEEAFLTFTENIPFYGLAILCLDHPRVRVLKERLTDRRVVTYGLHEAAEIQASNLVFGTKGMTFDVHFSNGVLWPQLELSLFGKHNVQNALVALAIAQELDISEAIVRKTFREFSGVKRRFTQTGYSHGVTIIDDYAHHPVEIRMVLQTARQLCTGKLIAVCQPHRYSRLSELFEDFVHCFQEADDLLLLPIYSAGEAPLPGISSQNLGKAVQALGKSVSILKDFETVAAYLQQNTLSGDMVVCMGAGDITKLASLLPERLTQRLAS